MNYKLSNRSWRSLTHLVLFIAALAATALGCVWVGVSDSVRFNDHLDYNEMGRLPPLLTANDDTRDATVEKAHKLTPERNGVLEYLKRNGISASGLAGRLCLSHLEWHAVRGLLRYQPVRARCRAHWRDVRTCRCPHRSILSWRS